MSIPEPPPARYTDLLEAHLLMATEPVATTDLAVIAEAPLTEVQVTLADLADWYTATGRGFELRNVGGGWRLWTRATLAGRLGERILNGQQAKLSQPALETLAVVAYLQPVARSRVSAVRGVNVDGVVRTLSARGLIAESDTDPVTGAKLYVTTDYFLERMGLASLDDLPDLAPYLPEASELAAELAAQTHPDATEPHDPGPADPVPDNMGASDLEENDEPA